MIATSESAFSGVPPGDVQGTTSHAATPTRHDPPAAAHFKRLLAEKADDHGHATAEGEADVAALRARVQARQAAWQQLQRGAARGASARAADGPVVMTPASAAQVASQPVGEADGQSSSSAESSAGHAGKATRKAAAATDRLPPDASAAALATQAPAASGEAQRSASTAAQMADAPFPADALGELAQLLSRHCDGIYVGVSASGGDVERVMLRLSGAMAGVSVELVSGAAGLQVRMHLRDDDTWDAVAAHKDELARALSGVSGLPVTVEPVFGGGKS